MMKTDRKRMSLILNFDSQKLRILINHAKLRLFLLIDKYNLLKFNGFGGTCGSCVISKFKNMRKVSL
jgi:hypothetical protein